jgi:hypothetical protein
VEIAAAPAASPPAPARASAIDSIIGTIGVPAEELEIRRAIPAVVPTVRKSVNPKKPAVAEQPAAKAKKVTPAKPDPAKLEPARWWVQVAGGARVADLDKDWERLRAKSSAAFRGKSAWTTPLRATNRLLAGPFKSDEDAQTFINALRKDGQSAFSWQSPAGQKIERLAPK